MTESRLKSDYTQFITSAFCPLPHGQERVSSQLPHNTTLTRVVCKMETSLQSSSISIWKALAVQTWGYATHNRVGRRMAGGNELIIRPSPSLALSLARRYQFVFPGYLSWLFPHAGNFGSFSQLCG